MNPNLQPEAAGTGANNADNSTASFNAKAADNAINQDGPLLEERAIPKVSETRLDKAGSRRAWSIIAAIAICLVAAAMFVGNRFAQWKAAMRAPSTATASNGASQPRQFDEQAPIGTGVSASGANKGVATLVNPFDPRAGGQGQPASPQPLPSPCPPGMVCTPAKPGETGEWKPPVSASAPIPFIPNAGPAADPSKRYYPDNKVDPYKPLDEKALLQSQAAARAEIDRKAAEMDARLQQAIANATAQANGNAAGQGISPQPAPNSSGSVGGLGGSGANAGSSDVFSGGGLRTSGSGFTPIADTSGSGLGATGNAQPSAAGNQNGRGSTGFVGTLSTSRNAASSAESGLDLNTTALKGRSFECALDSKLVSTLPGFFSCHLTENLYSANGRVVLAERGSEVTGETDGVARVGQSRIPLIASRLHTTKGVIINLDSPGTDGLGGSGIPGDVNNHWPQRIGAALLLAMVQDGFALAQANRGQVGTPAYQTSQSSTQTLAGKVLDSTINTPPTITKYQGERIRIFLARDLDFSPVYEIRKQRQSETR